VGSALTRLENKDLGNRHLVGGEGAGLIGADHGGGAKSLDGGKGADNGVLLSHLHGSKSKTGGNHGGKTLGNGGDGERDGDLEVVDGTLDNTAVDGVAEVGEVDNPDKNADDSDVLRKQPFLKKKKNEIQNDCTAGGMPRGSPSRAGHQTRPTSSSGESFQSPPR